MSDDANDVTKALAAFGAPSIRYHSFGQSHLKPSSVVLPRRVTPAIVVEPLPVVTTQAEPIAAPEPVPAGLSPASTTPHAHHPVHVQAHVPVPVPLVASELPAPVLRQSEPLRAPSPSVAPPPRPLAEWAAPVSATPPSPSMPPLMRPSMPAPTPVHRHVESVGPVQAASAYPPPVSASVAPSPSTRVPPLFPSAAFPGGQSAPVPPSPATPTVSASEQVSAPAAVESAVMSPTIPIVRESPALVQASSATVPHRSEAATLTKNGAGALKSRNLQDVFDFLVMDVRRQ